MSTSLSRAEVLALPSVLRTYSRKATMSRTFCSCFFTSGFACCAFALANPRRKKAKTIQHLFCLIVDILLEKIFFRLVFNFDKIGDQPTSIVAWPVELGQFKIPTIDLKKMEFYLLHRLEF